MNPLISRILIGIGIVLGILVLVRGFYYAPNGEIDSGLAVNSGATVVATDLRQLPQKLLIPKLGIEAGVQRLGITKSGNMAAPNNFTDVSWYKYGATPGTKGSAVIAGHVDNALGTPAVFYNLKDLETGDDIYVVRADGKKLRFRVINKEIYRYDKAPAEKIFNDSSGTYLNLITCQGDWVPAAKSAEFRLVVYTELVE